MVEFINLCQGGISGHDYTLKCIQLVKYSPSFVCNPRDEMSRFVKRVSDELQKECQSVMLYGNMNISCSMVHARRTNEARSKRKDRDTKRERSFEGGPIKDIQFKEPIKDIQKGFSKSNFFIL